jgi:hypothetical protein
MPLRKPPPLVITKRHTITMRGIAMTIPARLIPGSGLHLGCYWLGQTWFTLHSAVAEERLAKPEQSPNKVWTNPGPDSEALRMNCRLSNKKERHGSV